LSSLLLELQSIRRYKGHAELENLDGVAKLIERTGFIANRPGPQRVPSYPEKYFARVKIPKTAIKVRHHYEACLALLTCGVM